MEPATRLPVVRYFPIRVQVMKMLDLASRESTFFTTVRSEMYAISYLLVRETI
jgi:hypothetical protein